MKNKFNVFGSKFKPNILVLWSIHIPNPILLGPRSRSVSPSICRTTATVSLFCVCQSVYQSIRCTTAPPVIPLEDPSRQPYKAPESSRPPNQTGRPRLLEFQLISPLLSDRRPLSFLITKSKAPALLLPIQNPRRNLRSISKSPARGTKP